MPKASQGCVFKSNRGPCIDLHTHSNASDGSDTPEEVMQKAAQSGVTAVALTDHDTTMGLAEARDAAQELGLEFIGGCELSADGCTHIFSGDIKRNSTCLYRDIHILGLWVSENDATLNETLAGLRNGREERSKRIIAKLNALGFSMNYGELLPILGDSESCKHTAVGRPHIAELMRLKGYVSSTQQAFNQYLCEGGPAYEPKIKITPIEAIKILRASGATVALAHPLLIRAPSPWINDLVSDLAKNGLDALEVYHSEHSQTGTRQMVELATRHNLLLCGGSDYHGKNKPRIRLGSGKGNLHIPSYHLEKMKERRKNQGLPV